MRLPTAATLISKSIDTSGIFADTAALYAFWWLWSATTRFLETHHIPTIPSQIENLIFQQSGINATDILTTILTCAATGFHILILYSAIEGIISITRRIQRLVS